MPTSSRRIGRTIAWAISIDATQMTTMMPTVTSTSALLNDATAANASESFRVARIDQCRSESGTFSGA
ncbi:Uncharacterised protein [Mycobacterium tuberculosis]|uniref:Uncharacterized protein n=1 Tax=Mycobacterium tuberculosis TaxID=1773 RepID=A0A654U1R7_MYCTX|nr:Uncharacterised protein [Mycobacterium tuberculosis]CFS34055.1 Uncharacterised protein [Mycobacterium tuberculosis]CKP21947.1 Uncharacterised protein [Mycobacterium tuberculosis]